MRKKFAVLCLTGAVLFSGSACSAYNVTAGMGDGEHYDAVISVKGREEVTAEETMVQTAERDRAQLEVLLELFGKTDEQAAKLLNGGTENRTADDSWLVGRIYTAQLFEEACSVYTSYDEKGEVFLVLAQLTGKEERYLTGMETVTGAQGKLREDEEGDRRWQWEYGDYLITLYDTKGHLSLDIVSIQS